MNVDSAKDSVDKLRIKCLFMWIVGFTKELIVDKAQIDQFS